MANNDVTLSVKADLAKAIESLQRFQDQLGDVSETFKTAGKQVDQQFNDNVKKTEGYLGKVSSLGRRLADQIRGDFKSLASLESLTAGMKLSSQFKGSIRETVNLSDTIRKLGATFGVAEKDFSRFQSTMTKGLGDIGMSSDVASRTLEGLSQTQVRGEANLLAYSKAAGELASIGREQGREGDIAKMISQVIQAKGGNVNDVKQMQRVSNDVLAVRQTTGMAPSEVLKNMEHMFTNMSSDFRKQISTRGLATMAGAAGAAGPNATAFVEAFLKLGKTQRAGLEARGMGKLFGEGGFNPEQIKKFNEEAKRLGGGDMRLGLKAMGIESDEAAEGFLRLVDNLDKVVEVQRQIQQSSQDLTATYKKSMGMGEAFNASINRIKAMVSGPLADATQGITGALGGAAQSDAGAAAVVAGGGILAAMLAGGGLRGVGRSLGGVAKAKAEEAVTGEKVIPVRVVNASEIGVGLGAAPAAAGGVAGKLGSAAAVAGAGAVGFALGEQVINPLIESKTQGTTQEGFTGNVVERLFFKLDKLIGGEGSRQVMQAQKVVVELNKQDLKQVKPGSRGGSQ